MRCKLCFGVVALSLLLAGCGQTPTTSTERYRTAQDVAPLRTPTAAELYPLTPRLEPLSRRGNLPYQVNGQAYAVKDSAEGYVVEGIASWYGEKFHGHLTSNGEFYDMFSLSAAHKTLPLPSWVKVTNLNNNKEVIVRVNDRGPFHAERVIDLSYAAAYALDMHLHGTAPVRIEAIDLGQPVPSRGADTYIQVAAAREIQNLDSLRQRLQEIYSLDATTRPHQGLNRLLLGPFDDRQIIYWMNRLQADGFEGIFRLSSDSF